MRLLPIAISKVIPAVLLTALCAMLLGGCATPTVEPHHFLDEETAATITMVAEPWIFIGDQIAYAAKDRGYLNLFGVDVNRMGTHRQYIAALVSTPPALSDPSKLTLELRGGGQTLTLQPTMEETRKLGFVKPLAPAYSPAARWWYFPVTKEILGTIMRSTDLDVAVVAVDTRMVYTKWRDGSAEIAELTAVLP
jgi:hypothetical protein